MISRTHILVNTGLKRLSTVKPYEAERSSRWIDGNFGGSYILSLYRRALVEISSLLKVDDCAATKTLIPYQGIGGELR